jgi:predicted transcriptional regulator
MIKPGRPRLDDSPSFREGFATILPRLNAGEISQGKAARELGISVRSLKRYVKQSDGSGGSGSRATGTDCDLRVMATN